MEIVSLPRFKALGFLNCLSKRGYHLPVATSWGKWRRPRNVPLHAFVKISRITFPSCGSGQLGQVDTYARVKGKSIPVHGYRGVLGAGK